MPTVKDLLDRKPRGAGVLAVSRDATVLAATRMMNQQKVGAVVVTDGDKVVGIFTERDVLTRVVAAGHDPEAIQVNDVMTTPVACCNLDTTVEECRAVITDNRIRHLPVVEDGPLAGIVSSGDIMAFERADHLDTIKWLNEYLHGPFEPVSES